MQSEKQLNTGELTLNYFEGPNAGPPLVLLHGMTGVWQAWQGLLPELTKNWHVLAPDFRGHGKTGRSPEMQFRNQDYARDSIALLKSIGEPAVLVGHSLGGMVSIVVAAQFPAGVRGLVLVDPPLFTASANVQLHEETTLWFKLVLSIVKDQPTYEQVLAKTRTMMPDADENLRQAQAFTIAQVAPGTVQTALDNRLWEGVDLRGALSQIKCPIRVIHGDWAYGGAMRDEDITPLKENFPSTVVVGIPNATHQIPFEHPDVVIQQINALLPISDRR